LMVLETARDTGPWAQGGLTTVRGLDPEDKPYLGAGRPFGGTHFTENSLFKRGHSLGCNALMMDGSVRFIADTTSPEVLEALATIAGGEKVPQDY
jgi:prepilin-type processing-associated H-X9-DG protein